MFIVFTFNTHETWYSNVKSWWNSKQWKRWNLSDCVLNWLLKRKTQKWFHSSPLSGCFILKTQGVSVIFKHCWGYFTFLSDFWCKYIISYWVHSFQLRVHSIWFREYGVPDFESAGYMVSEVLGYIVSRCPLVNSTVTVSVLFCCQKLIKFGSTTLYSITITQ